jgi:fatty-acyl-CoA synthase
VIDDVARRTPEADAARFPAGGMTYSELREASRLAGRRLLAAGVRPGDRVGVMLPAANEDYIAICLGALRFGAVAVPINSRYKVRELEHIMRHAELSLLYTCAYFGDLVARTDVPTECTVVIAEDAGEFFAGGERVGEDELDALAQSVESDMPARIVYTSGTTAEPKGCVHTQGALVAMGRAVSNALDLAPDDRFWTPLTMFHVAGWVAMLAAHARGACFHHVGLFNPGTAVRQLAEQRCTVAFASFETIWMAVLESPEFEDADLSALRIVLNVGVPKRLELMQNLLPGACQISMTGSTEAGGLLSIADPAETAERRTRIAGRPVLGMEARIVDPVTGTDLADGHPGELLFRGSSRFSEYFRDPVATAESIDADGWFHSGDLLVREPDGNLVFVSRLKDMLKVGGENVAAAEIESYLLTHPAISMVQVVAAPDDRYGTVPAAFIEPHPGAAIAEQEVIDFCLDQIATFKVPRYVRIVDEWPMSGTKIQKYVLRDRIADELRRSGTTQAPRLKPARSGSA